jgi:hypothetical protein
MISTETPIFLSASMTARLVVVYARRSTHRSIQYSLMRAPLRVEIVRERMRLSHPYSALQFADALRKRVAAMLC